MAAIENLEIVVDVDLGDALAKLEKLQEELQDVAEEIEKTDAIAEDGITVRTSVDELEDDLAELKSEIETFEATESIDIDTSVDRSNLRDLDLDDKSFNTTPSVEDDINLGIEGLEDGELSVRSMHVAAANVTVIGGGGGGGDLSGTPFSPGGDPGNRGDFGDAFSFEGDGPFEDISDDISKAVTENLNIQDEVDDLGESMKHVRKTSLDLDSELEGFKKDLGDTDMRMQMMEAGRAGNMRDLSAMFTSGGDTEFDFGVDRDRRFSRRLKRISKRFGDMVGSLSEFDLRMSDIHNLLARFVPMLAIIIGTIPAAVTALVGLAAAAVSAAVGLAALAGLGALGLGLEDGEFNMDNLTDAVDDIRDDFIEAFAPLAERLQPLFEDGLDALDQFFNELANEGQVLTALTDEARNFGGFLMDFIPMVLNAMVSLADALSPLLADIGDFMKENLHQIMRSLVRLTARAVPVIAQLAQKIAAMLPALVKMSLGFAKVANIIFYVVGIIVRLASWLNITPELLGLVTAALFGLGTALLIVNSRLYEFAATAITNAITSLYGFFVSLLTADSALAFLAGTTIAQAILSLASFVVSVITGQTSLYAFAASAFTATGALAAFMTVATLGAAAALVAVALGAAQSFLGLADGISKATDNLKEYNRVSGRTEDDAPNPYNNDLRNAKLRRRGGTSGDGVVVIESSGDNEQARSQGTYASWRQGRTTGGSP